MRFPARRAPGHPRRPPARLFAIRDRDGLGDRPLSKTRQRPPLRTQRGHEIAGDLGRLANAA
jgi:hypothetical protein